MPNAVIINFLESIKLSNLDLLEMKSMQKSFVK